MRYCHHTHQGANRRMISPSQHARRSFILVFLLCAALLLAACQLPAPPATDVLPPTAATAPAAPGKLVLYSGRNENLVGPLIAQYRQDHGVDIEVRYADTAELAATILEEGRNSPADIFFAQDAGALGALAAAGVFLPLPAEILEQAPPAFRGGAGDWVGLSGRARVLVYNTLLVQPEDLPADVWALTGPEWQGRVGWAPTNGSFQAFITALRLLEGEERARAWLEGMIANGAQPFANNTAIVEATGRGEIAVGLVNHYYLFRFLKEQGESFPARNYFFSGGGAGAMINVAGAGVLATSKNQAAALDLLRFLLSPPAQGYFAAETNEYPLVGGVPLHPALPPLSELATPALDLSDLSDLQGTLELLQDTGALF